MGRLLPDTADQWPTTPPALRQTGFGHERSSVDHGARTGGGQICSVNGPSTTDDVRHVLGLSDRWSAGHITVRRLMDKLPPFASTSALMLVVVASE